MSDLPTKKAPWMHRVMVLVFSGLFAVLVYWLLGFVIDDVGTWPGPSYLEQEEQVLDPALVREEDAIAAAIEQTRQRIADEESRQALLRDRTRTSRETMRQLLEMQRLALEKGVTPSSEEQHALAESERQFLDNQRTDQERAGEIAELSERLRELEADQRASERRLAEARAPIRAEHEAQRHRHELRMAAIQLATLAPLLVVAVVLVARKRRTLYAPLTYAFGIAVAVKAGFVIHEHFPTRYFKYILILLAIAVVVRILVFLIRRIAFPRRELVLKQHREAYEAFVCPVCAYPIRRGPLRDAAWTRRSLRRLSLSTADGPPTDEPYTCPTCGTTLFEPCPACGKTRHALLPSCEHCGEVKAIELQ